VNTSNLGPKTTGIPGAVLWVSIGDAGAPRLWVVTDDSAVVVRLTKPPEALGSLPPTVAADVLPWIDRNRAVLLAYWRCEIDTKELVDGLVRV
jgi:hypothetical protein